MRIGIASLGVLVAALCALAPTADAAPIETPVDLNDFFFFVGDPVTIAADGSSALLEELAGITPILLFNDPQFGDPYVIEPAAARKLAFDYELTVATGESDEFGAFLTNSASFPIPGFEFFTTAAGAGSVEFDLSSLVPDGDFSTGLQFQLSSLLGDTGTGSSVLISNVRLIDPDPSQTPPIPEPGTWALFGFAATAAYIARRRRNRNAA